MTCIIGIVHNGKAYIGSDSGITSWSEDTTMPRSSITAPSDAKVFTKAGMLMSGMGAHLPCQLIQYTMELDGPQPDEDLTKYLVNHVVLPMRSLLADHDIKFESEEREHVVQASSLMVGVRGRLFTVSATSGVLESPDPWLCMGLGEDVAAGYLMRAHYEGRNLTPNVIISQALKAVSEIHPHIRPPWVILKEEDCA